MSLLARLYRYLPHQCPLCLNPCDQYVCPLCCAALPTNNTACKVCALPLVSSASVCGDCLRQAKPYRQTLCPLLYGHPLDRILYEFKNQRPLIAAQPLLPPLLKLIEERYQGEHLPDLLVPVPMHWSKRLNRGYNQAQVLCELLGRHTGVNTCRALNRPLRLANQKSLNRKHRLRNLQRAFACRSEVSGRHIAVVDDVITSCATAMAACETLQRAGADCVDVWALARTPATAG